MSAEVAAALVEPLPPAERTLPAMLRRGAERHGDRPLLTLRRRDLVAPRPAAPRRGARPRRCAPPASAAATGWR